MRVPVVERLRVIVRVLVPVGALVLVSMGVRVLVPVGVRGLVSMGVRVVAPVSVLPSVLVSVGVLGVLPVLARLRAPADVSGLVWMLLRVSVAVLVLVRGLRNVCGLTSPFARGLRAGGTRGRHAALLARSMRTTAAAAPKPLSMLTTVMPEAQLVSIPNNAVIPPRAVP